MCFCHYWLACLFVQTYSFDLQRPSPANHRNEPIGTFEPVHLDDLGVFIRAFVCVFTFELTWLCIRRSCILLVFVCCDIDRPAPEDQVTNDDLSPPPVTNGTTVPSEEKGSSGENGTKSNNPIVYSLKQAGNNHILKLRPIKEYLKVQYQ